VRRGPVELKGMITARISVLEALEAGFEHRSLVVDLIANAEDRPHAEEALAAALGVDAAQAGAIMDARLTRWTVAERRSLEAEMRSLKEQLVDGDSS
jgi:DNA gyrase/topoisomerase IV subunit A